MKSVNWDYADAPSDSQAVWLANSNWRTQIDENKSIERLVAGSL